MKKLTQLQPGFTTIPNWFLRSTLYSGNEKIVYQLIASYNPSFISTRHIAKVLRYDRKTVMCCIKKLASGGMLRRFKEGRVHYYVCAHTPNPQTVPRGAHELVQKLDSSLLIGPKYTAIGPKYTPVLVQNTAPNKNKEKEQLKKEESDDLVEDKDEIRNLARTAVNNLLGNADTP